jgi:proline dehydrogenase
MFNKLIVSMIPLMPKSIVWAIGKKYIAGLNLDDAVKYTKELNNNGCQTTIDVLGEFVTEKERAINERDASLKVLESIQNEKLNSYLSIKPTSNGLGIDFDFGYENIKMLVQKAKQVNLRCRLDMENSPYTETTIKLYRKLLEEGNDNCGIVLQAYLKRTYNDIETLLPLKPNIRLCKGIYKESPDIAYQGKDEVRDNFNKCLELIVSNVPNGAFPEIATHDEILIQFAEKLVKEKSLTTEQYSFAMLLGVREERRKKLVDAGHNMVVYTPYGEDWYGYSTRRMKENPEIAGHVFKSMFGIGK